MKEGFKELGDLGGMGIGKTTSCILRHPEFVSDPHKVFIAAQYSVSSALIVIVILSWFVCVYEDTVYEL